MPGPLQAAGATSEPSEYAPLTMDRYITGLWTQRSPLRDAAVPYLYTKFYSASRFDSLIDGLNREVTARLTLARRCGLSVYNANTFPPINSFYPFKLVRNGAQSIRVMADTASDVYDATAGQQSIVFSKSAGAGKTRFLGVGNNTLYFSNGTDQKKWMQGNKVWAANTAFSQGDFIVDTNGNIQSIILPAAMISGTIASIEVTRSRRGGTGPYAYFLVITFTAAAPKFNIGGNISFSGLTTYTALNGQTLVYSPPGLGYNIGPIGANQIATSYGSALYTNTADTGTVQGAAQANSGVSGGAMPAWSAVTGTTTADGTIVWTCFGSAVKDWGIASPASAPVVTADSSQRFWYPKSAFPQYTTVLDTNGNYQIALSGGATLVSGATYPKWSTEIGAVTIDGSIGWACVGTPFTWLPSTTYTAYQSIVDPNGNVQLQVGSGASGATAPAWNAAFAGTTADGAITWINCGPGVIVTTGPIDFAYSWHALDGSVSNASPVDTFQSPVLGPTSDRKFTITGVNTDDTQCDAIWLWETVQGGSILLLLDEIANPDIGIVAGWTYLDSSTDEDLNALIEAPINQQNNPPQDGNTAPAYHLNRIWMINRNSVNYSEGPDALVGNGNTAFPPLNFFQFPELITRLIPITLNNGGLLCVGTANLYVILGTGTSSNPFYSTTYMNNVGVLSYDEIEIVGSTLYCFTNNSKFVSLDPSAGYTECGFPIGDQFLKVTTGNANGGGTVGYAYTPGSCYVAWNERTSGDSGIYVTDGTGVGWFRYSPVASPESGYLWSPRAQIVGGVSAVQNCEVTTGDNRLLVGPKISGPILMRDNNVFMDNGSAYSDCYATIGNVILCESGEVAEVAHVALKSMRVGDRPVVKMLFGEIAATADVPFETYEYSAADPPDLPEAQTLYNDRYVMMDQSGVCPKCDHVQLMVQWPVQTVNDELLTHAIYGAKWAERKQNP